MSSAAQKTAGAYFVSLVGEQAFGALNALLSLRKSSPPDRCFLCHTSRTEAAAQRISDWAKFRGLPEMDSRKIGNDIAGPGGLAETLTGIAAEAEGAGRRIIFNLNGAMNYMIGAAVITLWPFRPLLINVSRQGALLYDTAAASAAPLPPPPNLPVEDILQIQGAQYTCDPGQKSKLLDDCRRMGVVLPRLSLTNIKMGNLNFEVVWNCGANILGFLKDFRGTAELRTVPRLARSRAIAGWAAARAGSQHVFDRNTCVLVDYAVTEEQLARDSHKLLVGNVAKGVSDPTRMLWNMRSFLNRWFHPLEFKTGLPPQPDPAALPPLDGEALIVCLGPDPAATLKAILSHKKSRVVLCVQPDNQILQAMARKIQALAPSLGVKTIDIVPLDTDGNYPDRVLPPLCENARAEVNITPGTKCQGAMLTVWAIARSQSVWSIKNASKTEGAQCQPLFAPHGEAPVPAAEPDPLLPLMVRSQDFLDSGEDAARLAAEKPFYSAMLAFMRAALGAGRAKDLFARDIVLGKSSLRCGNGGWVLKHSGREFAPVSRDDGHWFERLAGVAFHEAGAVHCRVRVRLTWSEEISCGIQELKYLFRRDLDVLASMPYGAVLVSCKAHWGKDKGKFSASETREAAQAALSVSRFALPVLACLFLDGPPIYDRNCLVIGWTQLCQPDLLAGLIRRLADSKRSTGG